MTAEAVSRRARRFVLTSAGFLVLWQASEVVGIARQTGVILGVLGFVLHMVFGKAYSLVPSYFNRELTVAWAPALQLPLTAVGVVCLAAATLRSVPPSVGMIGALLWAGGICVFVGTLVWTIRDNLVGSETGTSDANADRRPIDRTANAFMPIALAYLVVGSYELLAIHTALPTVFDGYFPRVSHLLAAGVAAMIVFAIGFRLLPRFLVAAPPRFLVAIVLPTGAVGPLLIAGGLPGRSWLLRVGALFETVAVLGFAVVFATLFHRSDRDRVGFYGVLGGAASGSLAVLLGVSFVFGGITAGLTTAHFRLNVLGFLGLTIVGIAYQFYPPAVGSFRGASDRTALASLVGLGGGLGVEVVGILTGVNAVTRLGRGTALLGALIYAGLIAGLFYDRYH